MQNSLDDLPQMVTLNAIQISPSMAPRERLTESAQPLASLLQTYNNIK